MAARGEGGGEMARRPNEIPRRRRSLVEDADQRRVDGDAAAAVVDEQTTSCHERCTIRDSTVSRPAGPSSMANIST
jgi:hypothetical protein